MAITVTESSRTVFGDKRVVFANVAFDTSYDNAEGGELVSAADFPSLAILDEIVIVGQDPDGVSEVRYDPAVGRFLVFVAATGAEVADDTDPGVAALRVMAVGLG